ncbi:MAG: hypothetical protein GY789_24715 [Hyphomicrobiales bacterium]|nr:hypothetical protein [Hyphomicrobiales bacterium]MCP4997794.1 hypothetical protein [Hyphomicrobiales bacterium]
MRMRLFAVLSILFMGLYVTSAHAQEASGSDDQADFIIKVPVRFDNLHKDITGSYVHCGAYSPDNKYGEQTTPASASSGDLGTGDFDDVVELKLSVRDYWDPADTTEIVCEMSFNVKTDRGLERIDSSLYGPTTAFGQNRDACRNEVEWLRAACTEKGTTALGIIRHSLTNAE